MTKRTPREEVEWKDYQRRLSKWADVRDETVGLTEDLEEIQNKENVENRKDHKKFQWRMWK